MTLLASTKRVLHEHLLLQRWLCGDGVAVVPKENEQLGFIPELLVLNFVFEAHAWSNPLRDNQ